MRISVLLPARLAAVPSFHALRQQAMPAPRIDVSSQPLVHKRRFIEFYGLILQELSLEIASALSAHSGGDFLSTIEGRPGSEPKLVVSFVMPGSPADDLFFAPGNVITHVNGERIRGADAFIKKVKTRTRDSKVVVRTQLGGIGVFYMDKAARDGLVLQSPPMHTAKG